MFSRKDRMKAIELYIKNNRNSAKTIRELGYPSRNLLRIWYRKYVDELKTGIVWDAYKRKNRYSVEQRKTTIQFYLSHGRNKTYTVKTLGYPCREVLQRWCAEAGLEPRKIKVNPVQCTSTQKQKMVIDLCTGEKSAIEIANQHGITRDTIYSWKEKLLGKGYSNCMQKKDNSIPSAEREDLLAEIKSLQRQVWKLRLETEILKKAKKLLKKDLGIDIKNLSNKEKTILVDALRNKYSLSLLRQYLHLPRSSYFYHHKQLSKLDKYAPIRVHIRALFFSNKQRYGYRRIKAPMPNAKWVTDITEFRIPAGKVYLSPIIDCHDGYATIWTIDINPNAELVNTMLDKAIHTLQEGDHPIVHSDRGGHYRWPGWIERMTKEGLTRSMSRKGCTPDNAACEGFFGRLKNELFYNQTWEGISLKRFMTILNDYLVWYNEKRFKLSLGGLSPLEYRRKLGYTM